MKLRVKTRELIAVLVMLSISLAVNIPGYLKDKVQYDSEMRAKAEEAALVAKSDQWKVSSPEKQGMNPELLKEAAKSLSNTKAFSLLVVRRGEIVFEKYYIGSKLDSNPVFSVTKSYISALVGIAIEKGYIKSVDQRVLDFFPEYRQNIDSPLKNDMTIRHLLTMTPGFLEDLNVMVSSPNWTDYIFKLPLKYKPGEKFQYANASSHLLSVILSKATGMSTLEFAEKNLFGPLGTIKKQWIKDPQGYYSGYANLNLRPRDMAKLGQLYLDKGRWDGIRIVPEKWVQESTRKHVSTEDSNISSPDKGYGYQWWTDKVENYRIYQASGAGGQGIIVIPDLEVVVVVTSIPYTQFSVTDAHKEQLIKEFIIPACN